MQEENRRLLTVIEHEPQQAPPHRLEHLQPLQQPPVKASRPKPVADDPEDLMLSRGRHIGTRGRTPRLQKTGLTLTLARWSGSSAAAGQVHTG